MRLINVDTYKLREFFGSRIPRYAILTHTWGRDEVLFHDLMNLSPAVEAKACFDKIRHACRLAKADGFYWVWVDTCCIDKASSAELSEAINSMFQWYLNSAVCFAYLEDISSSKEFRRDTGLVDARRLNASLENSR